MNAARFELFVASRYLRAKRREAMISLITWISVAGVAAGVMALVIALAINNGFRQTLESSLLGATPHVVLLEKQPGPGIAEWRGLCQKMRGLAGVRSAEPALYGKVMGSAGPLAAEVTVKGTRLETEELRRQLRLERLPDMENDRGLAGVVLGVQLARRLGLKPGDVVTLISPQGQMTPFGIRPLQLRFRVAATFESGFYDLDNQYALTSLKQAQRLFALNDVVNAIELKVTRLDDAPAIAKQAEQLAGPELGATHWMDQNRQLLNALKLEKIVSLITISLIQIVAALNILTALFMSVMDKRRDIAVLRSMGARASQIARIFISQGLLIAAAGIALGLTLGYSLSYCADRFQWIPLDNEIYSMSYVPFASNPWDALWIVAAALSVTLAATLYPARAATRITPVETLRYE